MKFRAITINGTEVDGCGVAKSEHEIINGKEIAYLFTDPIQFIDGREFEADSFEFVYADTIVVVL